MEKPKRTIYVEMAKASKHVEYLAYEEIRKLLELETTVCDTVSTLCTDFFCFETLDEGWNVIVGNTEGEIDLYDLLHRQDEFKYTAKNMRKAHNARKMLIAGAFNYKPTV